MKETKIAALKDSIAQLEQQEKNQQAEIEQSIDQIGHVVKDPLTAAKENEEFNRVHAIAEKKAADEAEFNKQVDADIEKGNMYQQIHTQGKSSFENDDILDMMNVQLDRHHHNHYDQNLMEVGAYDAMNVD